MRLVCHSSVLLGLLALLAAVPAEAEPSYVRPTAAAGIPEVKGALGAPDDPPTTPTQVVVLVSQVVAGMEPAKAKTTRFLSLHNLPRSDWGWWARFMSGHLNGLSRAGDIYKPELILDQRGAFTGLLSFCECRYDAEDKPRFSRVYETLGKVDPFFHDTVEEEREEEVTRNVEPYWHQGRWYTQKVYTEKRVKLVHGFAPWLVDTKEGKAALELCLAKMGGTDVPVLYADWFLWQTAIQYKRDVVVKAGYYDFLGIKDQKTYEEAIGFVQKGVDPERLVQLRAVATNSTVTGEDVVRALAEDRCIEGSYWRSFDTNQQGIRDKFRGNAIRDLDGKTVQFMATEAFGNLANGWWATGLFQGNIKEDGEPNPDEGKRQDIAPDFIASDSTAPRTDRRVHVNLSCLRCHVDGGLQDINDWARNVLNKPPAIDRPGSAIFGKQNQLRDLQRSYVKRLEGRLKIGRDRFEAAVLEATSWTAKQYSEALGKAWASRCSAPVSRARAARTLGVTPERLKEALITHGEKIDLTDWSKVLKASLKTDPVLASWRLDEDMPLPVTVWYDNVGLAQDSLRGVLRKPVHAKGK